MGRKANREQRRRHGAAPERNSVSVADVSPLVFSPRPVLDRASAERLRLSYLWMYGDVMQKTAKRTRLALEYAERRVLDAPGYPALVCAEVRGVVTGASWKDGARDPAETGQLLSLCLSSPEAKFRIEGERGARWLPFDSHVWLRAASMALDLGRGLPGNPGGSPLEVSLGDTLHVFAALQTYDDAKMRARRNGFGTWFPVESRLLYTTTRHGVPKAREVPAQLSGGLVLLRAEDGAAELATEGGLDAELSAARARHPEMARLVPSIRNMASGKPSRRRDC